MFPSIARRCATAALLAALGACKPATAPVNVSGLTRPTAAVPDVQHRIDAYATVRLTADLDGLSADEKAMLVHFIRAAQLTDAIFWQQTYGNREALLNPITDPALRQLVEINYGPWDRLADFQPLVSGIPVKPPGANFYPTDITEAELGALDLRDRTAPYSVIRRDDAGRLHAIPYSKAFELPLHEAAGELRQAAALSKDGALSRYLSERAKAFETNEYQASDFAWLDMKSNHLDLIIGPIENYEDALQGARTSFEAYVLVKDLAWSERLARFAKLLPELQRGLPVPAAYKQETPGTDSELNAYDVLLYAGEANAGAKTIAINLPNDEQVQLQKGTRRLQLKNAMRAKFDRILVPIANELIASDQGANVKFDAFFANVMFHEVAHGLGIKRTLDGRSTARAALKEVAGALEEAKADILGLYLVTKLLEKRELRDTVLADHYVTFVAGILRSVRFSAADAHGKANMIEFNYFADQGAFTRDAATGRYHVNVSKARAATTALAARILKIQGDGDYAAALKAVNEEGVVRPELRSDLDRLSAKSIPVDVVFEQGVRVLGLE
jgi:Peptidase family M49